VIAARGHIERLANEIAEDENGPRVGAGGELSGARPSTGMQVVPTLEVRDLVEAILRTGLMLGHVFGDLLEELPADAFVGEDAGEVLLDMFTGTIAPVADAAGRQAVRQATALLGAVADRTITDLQAAAELAADGDA